MCGICGYISKTRTDDDVLCKMRDTMVHRGPDDAGAFSEATGSGYMGMAQRRLSIFDLSQSGHQPMFSDDNRYAIVFNGEIYNFLELREELIREGFSFRSDCDTEVILYAYALWKTGCFERFNGMFAIAIWDREENELILARDRMGVKPLYYYHNKAAGTFVFGSELKPVMMYPGFCKDIRKDMIGNFLCSKYIAAPDTIFADTYKLIPGAYMVFRDNETHICRYWDILQKKKEESGSLITSYEEAKLELERLLTDAVKLRLAADVPVGTFLSSGIDSALITALAGKVSDTRVKTFTIGFYEKERNEADSAKRIAEYLGTDHTEIYVGEKEIYDMIEDLVIYYDEPFSDSSQLPTMLVSKLASKDVTVALSGDGGDEIFCGYKMYDWTYIAQKADPLGSLASHLPFYRKVEKKIPPELRAFINNRDKGQKTQLYIDVMTELADGLIGKCGTNPKFGYERMMDYPNWQERRMMLDMMTYLPDEIMAKTDRASMKYSLEVRSPLLDYRIVERSFAIPHDYKYHRFNKKYILKELAYDHVPKELLSGKKRGFGVPLAKWLRGPLKKEIDRYSETGFIKNQGIFDISKVNELKAIQAGSDKIMYSSMLWSFFVFQRWFEEYVGA